VKKLKDWEKILTVFLAIICLIISGYLYKIPIVQLSAIGLGTAFVYVLYKFLDKKLPKAEPMKEALEWVKHWWYYDMKMGEELTYEEGEGEEGYFGDERVYGFTLIRPSKERELLICPGTSPRRVMIWDDVPMQTNETPFDMFEKSFGVRPLPHPKMDIEKHLQFYGRRKVIRKEKKSEEEIVGEKPE